MTTTMPEDYDSDDLDRLVREADRKEAQLRHLDWDAETTDEEYDTGDTAGLTDHEAGIEAYETFMYSQKDVCLCRVRGLRAHLKVDHDALVDLYGGA